MYEKWQNTTARVMALVPGRFPTADQRGTHSTKAALLERAVVRSSSAAWGGHPHGGLWHRAFCTKASLRSRRCFSSMASRSRLSSRRSESRQRCKSCSRSKPRRHSSSNSTGARAEGGSHAGPNWERSPRDRVRRLRQRVPIGQSAPLIGTLPTLNVSSEGKPTRQGINVISLHLSLDST